MIRKTWLLMLLSAAPAWAAFQTEFTSARSAALGGAVAAQGSGTADLFVSPAALAALASPEVSLMYGKPFSGLDGVEIGQGAAAFGAPSRWGQWGVGAASFRADGAKEERTLAASYATGFGGGLFRAGATVKHMSHRYLVGARAQNDPLFRNGTEKSAVDFDLGMSARVMGPLTAGLTVRNARAADVGLASSDRLRREVQAGFTLDLTDWGVKASGDLLLAARDGGDRKAQPAFGVEKSLRGDAFSLRAGANQDRFATGLGVRYKALSLDYALLFNRAVSDADASAHQVQMTWRFAGKSN